MNSFLRQFFLLLLHGYVVHSQDFTPDQINAAVAGAQRDVQQRQSAATLQRQGGAPAAAFAGIPLTTAGGGATRTARTGLRRFNQRNNPQLNAEVARGGEVTQRATLALRGSSPAAASAARSLSPLNARAPAAGFSLASTMLFRNAAAASCEDDRIVKVCDPFQRYRETDGQCNNLIHASFPSGAYKLGAAFTAQGRFLFPDYDNGVNSPRVRSVIPTQFLPDARFVSRSMHSGEIFESDRHTPFLTHFGQFIDHDIVSTPESEVVFSSSDPSLHCCLEPTTDECFNINFAPDALLRQPNGAPGTCISFIRAECAPDYFCRPGPRLKQNQRSSYIDGTMIYGWDDDQEGRLRDPADQAKLLSQGDEQLKLTPITDEFHQACIDSDGLCFEAGDHRSLETVPLTVMHIMFVRRHNRIVEALRAAALSPLNAEILYQEAKRIVIAELQHITYNEFLPRVLGVDVMNRYDLWPASLYRDTYDPYVDPRTTSGFSVAAYRFGHSLVRNIHNQVTPFGGVSRLNLQDHFDRLETHLYPFPGGNTEGFARWMKISQKSAADRAFVDGLQNNLFPCDGPDCPMGGGVTRTLDLAALNIQRGRDHGLPSYREWRYRCTGRWAYTFEPNAMGLSDHSQFEAINLWNTYSHVGDIDLFTGGMTETRLPGALVGPTFACIIGQQFQNYKRGDRFFYEREDPVMAFTPGQLQAIKQTSLAKILCSTMRSFSNVQRNAMDRPSFGNIIVDCDSLRDQDIIAKIPNLWNNLPPSVHRSAAAKSATLARRRRPLVSNRFQDPAFLRLTGGRPYKG